jgi:hypothetical protein
MSKTNIKKFQKLIKVANTIAVSYFDYYQMAAFLLKRLFTKPLFIDVFVLSLESEWLCVCVLEVSRLPLFTIRNCSDSVVVLVFILFHDELS